MWWLVLYLYHFIILSCSAFILRVALRPNDRPELGNYLNNKNKEIDGSFEKVLSDALFILYRGRLKIALDNGRGYRFYIRLFNIWHEINEGLYSFETPSICLTWLLNRTCFFLQFTTFVTNFQLFQTINFIVSISNLQQTCFYKLQFFCIVN